MGIGERDENRYIYEEKPFLLISNASGFAEYPKMIEDYCEIILLNISEEERKRITKVGSLIRRIIGYKNTKQKRHLINLFGKFYDSFESLKEELRKGGLEKTAGSIRMIPPNETNFGLINYNKGNGNEKIFGYYRSLIISEQDYDFFRSLKL